MVFIPDSYDWMLSFRPAALAMFHGASPYGGFGFYNAPWMLLPFIPFALMPENLGRLCVYVLGILSFFVIAYKFKASPLLCALFLLSYTGLASLHTGGLDWFSMLGLVMPAPFGLMFAVTKPQIGFGISVYWLIESWRVGRFKQVFWNFLPVTILIVGSTLLYGPWMLEGVSSLHDVKWNISMFPYAIPLGLVLFWVAFRDQNKEAAIAASPFFAPYHSPTTLAVTLIPLLKKPRFFAVAWVLLWVFGFIFRLL